MRQGLRCCYCRERLSDEERSHGDGRHCTKCTVQMSAAFDQNSADFLSAFEPLLREAAPDTKYIVAPGAGIPRSKVPWSGYAVKCDGVLFIASWSLIVWIEADEGQHKDGNSSHREFDVEWDSSRALLCELYKNGQS